MDGRPEDVLRVTPTLAIPLDELSWRYDTSGGPGGQHANTSHTRVEVRFDVATSPSLGPRQRARLLDRLGPEVRVASAATRSQSRNREAALARLAEVLAAALRVQRKRVPTAPGTAARQRRLAEKHLRSTVKKQRRRPATDE